MKINKKNLENWEDENRKIEDWKTLITISNRFCSAWKNRLDLDIGSQNRIFSCFSVLLGHCNISCMQNALSNGRQYFGNIQNHLHWIFEYWIIQNPPALNGFHSSGPPGLCAPPYVSSSGSPIHLFQCQNCQLSTLLFTISPPNLIFTLLSASRLSSIS